MSKDWICWIEVAEWDFQRESHFWERRQVVVDDWKNGVERRVKREVVRRRGGRWRRRGRRGDVLRVGMVVVVVEAG